MDEVIALIKPLYKKEEVEKIEHELTTYIEKLPKVELQPYSSHWYKNSTLYTIYPDSLQTKHGTPLENIKNYLPQVKKLGCNAVHLLPFLNSPLRDKGFDVSDYYKIREGLGGMGALKELKKEADTLGIHIFMDLIFNHVSIDHEWFLKAQKGSEYYRNFFITTKETPQFLGKINKNAAVWASYLVDGEKTLVSVAFPEFAGEFPHWIQGEDGYWYYHTYYPSQIDVNWKNPEVFIELSKVLLYWASLGFNFRLDAIPFIGKSAYKQLNTHNPFTHHLTSVFNVLARLVNPNCIFILETSEHLDSEIEYFGTANLHQAHMLYDFHLTTYLWVSLVEKDVSYLWKQLKSNKHIPIHAQWINFLRNHDELSLAALNNTSLEIIHQKLLPFGKPFREGYGVAGRTYSLLGSDERRFLMSYFLLSSLPGSMLIPYGDEYGMSNIPASKLPLPEQADARNINRGNLTEEITESNKGKRIFEHMAHMVGIRRVLQDYLNVWPGELDVEKEIFGAAYKLGTSELVIFINTSDHHKTISVDTVSLQKIASINTVTFGDDTLELGPYGGIWLQR